jgi:hypothetical protein
MCWTTPERLRNAIYDAPANQLILLQLTFETCYLFFTSRTHDKFLSSLYAHGSLGSPQISLRHAPVPLSWSYASGHTISQVHTYVSNSSYFPLSYVFPTANLINLTHYDIRSVLLPIRRPMHKTPFIKRRPVRSWSFWVRCEP